MTVLTILNQGTMNSSSDANLVITKIRDSLHDATNALHNEGAGTWKLYRKGIATDFITGTVGGRGVEANVTNSVNWVELKLALGGITAVNLAGHSRGSITAYKIAHALYGRWPNLDVNVFAIDPVPGNTGHKLTRNGANYENIILADNVWAGNSFLLLAESDHRLVFRPYIDALYARGFPNHDFDTVPGTHGGINTLGGREDEAAQLVLSRALAFLQTHGTVLNPTGQGYILGDAPRGELYVDLMNNIKVYRAAATFNPFRKHREFGSAFMNFATGASSDGHRVANVNGARANFGVVGPVVAGAQLTGRGNFEGMELTAALDRMRAAKVPGQAYAPRERRFFCNLEHENLFRQRCPNFTDDIMRLERGQLGPAAAQINKSFDVPNEIHNLSDKEVIYLAGFLDRMGVARTGVHFRREVMKQGA